MGTADTHVRVPFPGDKAPVLHVSQAVVAAFTTARGLRVLVRTAQGLGGRADSEWVLPRRWVGRPVGTESLAWRALEGSGVRMQDVAVAVATARFDQASAVRPAGGLLSVVITALIPDRVVPGQGWSWLPVAELDGAVGLWDQDAVHVARRTAREMLRDNDIALRQVPPTFGVGDLRRVYEAYWGVKLNPSNFARQALKGPATGFLEPVEQDTGRVGRPAMLYRRGTKPAPSLAPN